MRNRQKIPPIDKRMIAVLENSETTEEQTAVFVEHLRENLNDCQNRAARAFLVFLGVVTVYTLLVKSQTTTFAVAGVEIARTSFAIVLIPAVAAFCFYRSVLFQAYASSCGYALLQYYKLRLPTFHENSLTLLVKYPSVLEGGYYLRGINTPLKYRIMQGSEVKMSLADSWDMALGFSCLVLPFIWFLASVYWTLELTHISVLFRVFSVVISAAFYVRTAMVIVDSFVSSVSGP